MKRRTFLTAALAMPVAACVPAAVPAEDVVHFDIETDHTGGMVTGASHSSPVFADLDHRRMIVVSDVHGNQKFVEIDK